MISLAENCGIFMRVRRKFWLLPILLMLAIFGGLIILTEGTAIAPLLQLF